MSFVRVRRVLASILALVAGVTLPGTAIAHGLAHAHERAEHHDVAAHATADHHGELAFRADDDSDREHVHPQMDRATSARFAGAEVFSAAPESTVGIAATVVVRETLIVPAARPRADPTHGPQPLPRSPPIR
jgi:hypothetical protein